MRIINWLRNLKADIVLCLMVTNKLLKNEFQNLNVIPLPIK